MNIIQLDLSYGISPLQDIEQYSVGVDIAISRVVVQAVPPAGRGGRVHVRHQRHAELALVLIARVASEQRYVLVLKPGAVQLLRHYKPLREPRRILDTVCQLLVVVSCHEFVHNVPDYSQ